MAGMFYTFEEAAEKLNKTEQELRELVEQGKLREFRDGSASFFKIAEIESFASAEGIPVTPQPEEAGAAVADAESFQPEQEQELPPPEFGQEEIEGAGLEEAEPEVADEDFDMASIEELVEEIPADEAVAVEKAPAAKSEKAAKKAAEKEAKKAAKEAKAAAKRVAKERRSKPKPSPRPRVKVARTAKRQRLSFGKWLLYRLAEDSPAAIFVLVLLFVVIVSVFAAVGYGLHFLYINF